MHALRHVVLALALFAGLPAHALDGVPCLLGGIVAFADCCCRPAEAVRPSCCASGEQEPAESPAVRRAQEGCACALEGPARELPARLAEAPSVDRLCERLAGGALASAATLIPHLDALPTGATGPPTGPHLVPPLRGGRTLLTVNCVARC